MIPKKQQKQPKKDDNPLKNLPPFNDPLDDVRDKKINRHPGVDINDPLDDVR